MGELLDAQTAVSNAEAEKKLLRKAYRQEKQGDDPNAEDIAIAKTNFENAKEDLSEAQNRLQEVERDLGLVREADGSLNEANLPLTVNEEGELTGFLEETHPTEATDPVVETTQAELLDLNGDGKFDHAWINFNNDEFCQANELMSLKSLTMNEFGLTDAEVFHNFEDLNLDQGFLDGLGEELRNIALEPTHDFNTNILGPESIWVDLNGDGNPDTNELVKFNNFVDTDGDNIVDAIQIYDVLNPDLAPIAQIIDPNLLAEQLGDTVDLTNIPVLQHLQELVNEGLQGLQAAAGGM